MFKKNSVLSISSIILTIFIACTFYQMDFRAFYIAGKSILFNLNPYMNNEALGLIDSCESRNISRFIYPPLSPYLFIPFSLLNYQIAKILWSLMILFSFHKLLNIFNAKNLIVIFFSFPVFFAFERGQIDLVICLLVVFSFKSKNFYISTLLLALATILKLFPVVLLPLLLLKWKDKISKKHILYTVSILSIFLLVPSISKNLKYIKFFINRKSLDSFIYQKLDCFIYENKIVLSEGIDFVFNNNFIHGQLNPLAILNYGSLIGLFIIFLIVIFDFFKKPKINYWMFSSALFYLPMIQLLNDKVWIMTLVYFIPFFLYHWRFLNKIDKFLFFILFLFPPLPYVELLIFPSLILLTLKIYFISYDKPSINNI